MSPIPNNPPQFDPEEPCDQTELCITGGDGDVRGHQRNSDYLRGTLVAELADDSHTFLEDSGQILRFHAVYQQDDRDCIGKADRDYSVMVRASISGGVLTAEQYLVADGLADQVGNGTLQVTSQQGLRWDHVRKGSLRPLIQTLNESLVTTVGACGEAVGKVVACPAPRDRSAPNLTEWGARIVKRFRPRTNAYFEIWVDGARTVTAVTSPENVVESAYRDGHLPRRFTIGIAASGDNCVDVFTHEVGLVPVVGLTGDLEAFTVLVGGGKGRFLNKSDADPRLADPLTTVSPADVADVVETVAAIQRGHGEIVGRKQARLRYLLDRWGLTRFRAEMQVRLGWRLPDPEPVGAMSHSDHLGWHRSRDGWWLGVLLENGRISDGEQQIRTALATIAEQYRPDFRFTPHQNVLLSGFSDADRTGIDAILAEHRVVPAAGPMSVVRITETRHVAVGDAVEGHMPLLDWKPVALDISKKGASR